MQIEKKTWESPRIILLNNDIVKGGTTTNPYPAEQYGVCPSPGTCYTALGNLFSTGAATSMQVVCGGAIVPACS